MTVYAGHAEFFVFLRDQSVHVSVGLAVVRDASLLLERRGVRGLAREADTSRLRAGLVDLELVGDHVGVAARFVVFDAEPPPVEQERQIGELGELVIGDAIDIVAPLVDAFPRLRGLGGELPALVLGGIGLSPHLRVDLVGRDLDGAHHLRLIRLAAENARERSRQNQRGQ